MRKDTWVLPRCFIGWEIALHLAAPTFCNAVRVNMNSATLMLMSCFWRQECMMLLVLILQRAGFSALEKETESHVQWKNLDDKRDSTYVSSSQMKITSYQMLGVPCQSRDPAADYFDGIIHLPACYLESSKLSISTCQKFLVFGKRFWMLLWKQRFSLFLRKETRDSSKRRCMTVQSSIDKNGQWPGLVSQGRKRE